MSIDCYRFNSFFLISEPGHLTPILELYFLNLIYNVPIALLLNIVGNFLSCFPSYHSLPVLFLPNIILLGSYIGSNPSSLTAIHSQLLSLPMALLTLHVLFGQTYWLLGSHRFLFGLTNLSLALNSQYVRDFFRDVQKNIKSIAPNQSSFLQFSPMCGTTMHMGTAVQSTINIRKLWFFQFVSCCQLCYCPHRLFSKWSQYSFRCDPYL